MIEETEVSGNRSISGLIKDAGCLFSGAHVHHAAGMFPPVTVKSSLPAPDDLWKPTCPVAETTQGSVPQQNNKQTLTADVHFVFVDLCLLFIQFIPFVFHKTTIWVVFHFDASAFILKARYAHPGSSSPTLTCQRGHQTQHGIHTIVCWCWHDNDMLGFWHFNLVFSFVR